MTIKQGFREWLFRSWYWYVNNVDKNAEVLFMNYGYSNSNDKILLSNEDENNRYSAQLYHHLASKKEIKNKDIAEIGCGRGGGLSYIARTFSPKTAHGVDLDKRAVSFCKKHYKQKEISFSQGNAECLDLKDNSYDVVLNVESSHRYPNMSKFLDEVKRILRKEGYFMITDFRYDYEIDELKSDISKSGMKIISEEIITPNVVKALELDNDRRIILIKKLVPKFLHSIAYKFAGTVGSETYNNFASSKYVYFTYILQK